MLVTSVVEVSVHISCQTKVSHFDYTLFVHPARHHHPYIAIIIIHCRLSVFCDSHAISCSQVSVYKLITGQILHPFGNIITHCGEALHCDSLHALSEKVQMENVVQTNTNVWKACSNCGVHAFVFQEVSNISVGHKRQDEVWEVIRSVKAHSQQTHNVRMVKSLHQQTLTKKRTKLLFG